MTPAGITYAQQTRIMRRDAVSSGQRKIFQHVCLFFVLVAQSQTVRLVMLSTYWYVVRINSW
jgi:hypothetical protein